MCVYALFLLQDVLVSLHEFAFEGQNLKFTANMLLTYIQYCDAGPGCDLELFAST